MTTKYRIALHKGLWVLQASVRKSSGYEVWTVGRYATRQEAMDALSAR